MSLYPDYTTEKMISNKEGQYSFAQSKDYIFVVMNCEKIYLFIALLMLSIGYYDKENINFTGVILAVIALGMFVFFIGRFLKQMAYQIDINFKLQKVDLKIYNKQEIIKFDEIDKIRVNGYIIFVLENKRKLICNIQNVNLIRCLNKIKKIEWGKLCFLFGPNKKTRSSIIQGKTKEA